MFSYEPLFSFELLAYETLYIKKGKNIMEDNVLRINEFRGDYVTEAIS